MKTFTTNPIHLTSIHLAIVAVIGTAISGSAFADCGGASVAEAKRAYAQAQTLESQGNKHAALGAYVQAQEYTCEKNPIEVDAAKRAAALALPLAAAAEQGGDFERAFRYYEDGAHYTKADSALMMHLRAQPDSPRAFENARSHFENRALPAFAENNAVRLKVTGAYQVSPKQVAEVLAMPPKGVERALQQEATAFNEAYLRETVQTIQSRPDSSADLAGMQRIMPTLQAHAQKWPNDLLKASRANLRTLREWGSVTRDAALASSVEKAYVQRIEHHVEALIQRYNGAPKFLDDAMDYQHMLFPETAQAEPRIAKVKALANKLGDEASAKQRLILASEYYDVAGNEAKAQAVRNQDKQNAMAKMQPSIDDMQRQAEALRAQYSDPAKVKAMQEQAAALRASMQQQQSGAKRANQKSAAELEKELGL
jgi:hypothetical protein